MPVIRDVYISEFKDMPFKERLYYVANNEFTIDWHQFNIGVNPLKWCALDLLKMVYLPILTLILIPILFPPTVVSRAISIKNRNNDDKGWFIRDRKMLR